MSGIVKDIQAPQCNLFNAKTHKRERKLIKGNKCFTEQNRSLSAAAQEDNKSDGYIITGTKVSVFVC